MAGLSHGVRLLSCKHEVAHVDKTSCHEYCTIVVLLFCATSIEDLHPFALLGGLPVVTGALCSCWPCFCPGVHLAALAFSQACSLQSRSTCAPTPSLQGPVLSEKCGNDCQCRPPPLNSQVPGEPLSRLWTIASRVMRMLAASRSCNIDLC